MYGHRERGARQQNKSGWLGPRITQQSLGDGRGSKEERQSGLSLSLPNSAMDCSLDRKKSRGDEEEEEEEAWCLLGSMQEH